MRNGNRGGVCGFRTPNSAFRIGILRQFHHVIEETLGLVAPDVQDGELAGMRSGNRRELLQALEFALEGTVFLEGIAMNNLHGAPFAEHGSRQPDFAVAAVADGLEQFVVGDRRRRRTRVVERGSLGLSGGCSNS